MNGFGWFATISAITMPTVVACKFWTIAGQTRDMIDFWHLWHCVSGCYMFHRLTDTARRFMKVHNGKKNYNPLGNVSQIVGETVTNAHCERFINRG